MISINLLPHRQMRQQQRLQRLCRLMAGAFSVGMSAVLTGVVMLHLQSTSQQYRRQLLQTELQQLEPKIAQQAQLQKQLMLLNGRLATLDHLRLQRNDAVRLLSELAAAVPDTIVLTALKQERHHLSLHGNAASHQDIARMLNNFDATETLAGAQLRHTTQQDERYGFIITVSRPEQPVAP